MHPGQIIRSAVSCVCLVRPPGDQNRTSKRTYHNTDVRTASVMTQAGPITLRRIAGRARETLMAWRVPGHAASQSRDHTREPLSVDEMLLRHPAPPCGGWPRPNPAGRHGAAERRAARRSGGTCAGRCVPTVAPRWPAAGKGGGSAYAGGILRFRAARHRIRGGECAVVAERSATPRFSREQAYRRARMHQRYPSCPATSRVDPATPARGRPWRPAWGSHRAPSAPGGATRGTLAARGRLALVRRACVAAV
jgi:hypothetical protein